MQRVLGKRVFRQLKENLFRYLALSALIILGMYLVISMVGAAETVIHGTALSEDRNRVEDGEFTLFVPLSDKEEQTLKDKDLALEKLFSIECTSVKGGTLRLFKNRENIDLVELDEGTMPTKDSEIVIENRYCSNHSLKVGDTIKVGDSEFIISGIGSSPDYDAPYQKLGDIICDSDQFGTAFVTDEQWDRMQQGGNSKSVVDYTYAYKRLSSDSIIDDDLKDKLNELTVNTADIHDSYFQDYWKETGGKKDGLFYNMTSFVKRSDNPRINAAAQDQVINKYGGLVAGVIVLILFTYVISVFVIHGIEKESSVIGALYALGVNRDDLLVHYLTLPVIVTFIAGTVGTMIGVSKAGIPLQLVQCYSYFSIPDLPIYCPTYLYIYGITLPPAIALIVNYFVIRKSLSQSVLSLMRDGKKQEMVRDINLGNMGFIGRFRIKQMLKEKRTGFTVIFGMFISMLIMMLALDCYVMCTHVETENAEDTKYEYMYTYKYPEKNVPKGGYEACAKTFKKEAYGYKLDVTVLGIHKDNPFFAADVEESESEVTISSAMSQKFGLEAGDSFIINDEDAGRYYAFTVKNVTAYSNGMYVFMDIGSMRKLFDENMDYYNVVFSDHELDIPSGRLYSCTSRQEVLQAAGIFTRQMRPLVWTLSITSVFIFTLVMYLMMKVMIERSSLNIALFRIFGYRMGEIRKLYLNGNFYMIAIGTLIVIPLSKITINAVYPYLVSNVASGMNMKVPFGMYAALYAGVLILYFIINTVLVGQIRKIVPAQVMKNRE